MGSVNLNSQLVNMQNQTNRVNFEKGQKNVGQSDLGKDGFFQLLLAQLQNQSPLEPEGSTDQMMQQAQFTQVEELQNLNANLTQSNLMSTASNYVGKDVTYTDSAGQTKEGRVDKVSFGDGEIGIFVDGSLITQDQITELRAPTN
jgi:flagellar basal-body rod modification protein FlgD